MLILFMATVIFSTAHTGHHSLSHHITVIITSRHNVQLSWEKHKHVRSVGPRSPEHPPCSSGGPQLPEGSLCSNATVLNKHATSAHKGFQADSIKNKLIVSSLKNRSIRNRRSTKADRKLLNMSIQATCLLSVTVNIRLIQKCRFLFLFVKCRQP